jgi:hypothetical protein
VSGQERPDRLAPGRRVSVDDIRELVGPATPHFALQIRDRVARLISGLEPADPARVEGERAIARLQRLADEGQAAGHVQEHEQPLPSLRLERDQG